MARLWIEGFERSIGSISGKAPAPEASRAGVRRRGRGMRFIRTVLQIPEDQQVTVPVSVLADRWYFCPRRFPTSGATRVWSHMDGTFTNASLRAWLTTAGALSFRNSADTEFLSIPMTLGTWVRMEVRVTRGSTPVVEVLKDGVSLYNANPGGTLTGASLGHRIGPPSGAGGDSEWDVDDWSGDDTSLPGPGRIRTLVPSGPGTYTAWTNSDWRLQRDIGVSQITAPGRAVGVTVGDRMSFVFDVSDLGALRAYRIGVNTMSTGQTMDYFVRINGTDTTVWAGIASSTGAGIQQRVSGVITSPTFTASDTVEIGVRLASGSNVEIKGMFLVVEDDGLYPSLAVDEADPIVRVEVGTYTGSGSTQEVTPFAAGVEPDFVFIWDHAGGSSRSIAWQVTHDEHGGRPIDTQNNAINVIGQFSMKDGVLLLPGGGNVNAAGQTYSYLAIRDRTFQMFYPFGRPALETEAADDITMPFADQAGFEAEFIMSLITQISGAGYIRDWAHTGDQSNSVTSGLTDDAWQAIAAGSVQVGTKLIGDTTGPVHAVALRTHPAVATLFGMLSWVGDGANPRVQNYPEGIASPDLIIIVPHTNNASFARQPLVRSRYQSSDYGMGGNIFTNGIQAIGASTFTVDTNGNRSGVTYTGLFFRSGMSGEFEFPVDPFGATVPLVWAEAFLET